ncbi:TRIP13 [Bugula neritina]|uniref:Pachytene checkpoint protein 2 homolog n=1 Tax=Bugula neritina TaxID=10212 RepID=A0A7J7KI50_BUGNE|nr:TRIP13 [Bugula neritina]
MDEPNDHIILNGHASLPIVNVDVCAKPSSTARVNKIKEHVKLFLEQIKGAYYGHKFTDFTDEFLQQHVDTVQVSEDDQTADLYPSQRVLKIHVYQCHQEGPGAEEIDDQEDVSAATHWLLPAAEMEGLWENLIFDSEIKNNLLQYAQTTMLFSSAKVDSNIISWNRVVLLHGPPGTGKTSLCKALAQKLCVRMSDRFRYGQLVEINSHGLFSKWFSESGKLVVKMFQKIQELIDDPEALICILMDEVESLTAVRRASGNEPSDAIRVVNALLTQIDQIKRYPNVLILTTSNVTGAIDLAFVDRADIKQYIGLPSPAAIYKIFTSCINELIRTGIIKTNQQIFDWKTLSALGDTTSSATQCSLQLREVSTLTEGLSGRTARKLPFLAHALYINTPTSSLPEFLAALNLAVRKQLEERADLCHQTASGVST